MKDSISGRAVPALFISEPIKVDTDSMSTETLAKGAPACPQKFWWHEKEYRVEKLLDSWRKITPEGGRKDAEKYVRSHYFKIKTTRNEIMTIYCDRKITRKRKTGWGLFTIEQP